jgi:hypothetical protein
MDIDLLHNETQHLVNLRAASQHTVGARGHPPRRPPPGSLGSLTGVSIKIPRRYVIILAVVAAIAFCPIFYQFFLPNLTLVPPPAIVPESAVSIRPPISSAATARIWTIEVFLIPDMSAEEVISFYEKRFFRCETTDFDVYPNWFPNTEWRCVRGRHAQDFIVEIKDGDENGTEILVEVSIYPLF